MASAFATFANDGKYCAPIAITSVTDATGAQLPAQATNCRDAHQARGCPRRELRAAGSPEPRLRLADPAADLHPDQLPDRGQDRYVKQQRLHLGCRPHHGPGDGRLVRRRAGRPETRPGQNVTINGKFYKGIDGYMIAGPHVLELHGPGRPGVRHRSVPGTAVEPAVRGRRRYQPPSHQRTATQRRTTRLRDRTSAGTQGAGAVRASRQEGRRVARGRGDSIWQAASGASGAALP